MSVQLDTVMMRGAALASATEGQCAQYIVEQSVAGHGGWVVTMNTDILRRYELDGEFRRLIGPATLLTADGMPLVWASRVKGTPLPERVTGSSLVFRIAEIASGADRSVFLLGGNLGTAEAASAAFSDLYPGLRVAGTYYPPFGFMAPEKQEVRDALREAVVSARPDIVFVALGSPLQEKVIGWLRDDLPEAWWLGVGISLSIAAGETSRAPEWMQRTSLEWLHRLAQEPSRLARRYLVDDLPYALGLMGEALLARLGLVRDR